MTVLHESEAVIEIAEVNSHRLRDQARHILGIGVGDDGASAPSGRGVAVKLGCLAAATQLVQVESLRLGPQVGDALGDLPGTLRSAGYFRIITAAALGLVVAAWCDRTARRRRFVVAAGAITWTVMLLAGAVARNAGAVSGSQLVAGIGISTTVLFPVIVADAVPARARFRALSVMFAMQSLGLAAGGALLVLGDAAWQWTWRASLLSFAVLSAVLALPTLMRPGRVAAHADMEALYDLVDDHGLPRPAWPRFGEAQRRLAVTPTVGRILSIQVALGILLFQLPAFVLDFFRDDWHASARGATSALALAALVAAVGVVAHGRRGETLFRRGPAHLLAAGAPIVACGSIALPLMAVAPTAWLSVGFLAVAFTAFAAVVPITMLPLMAAVPPRLRALVVAMAGVWSVVFGGLGGQLFLAGMNRHFGYIGTALALAAPGLVAANLLRSAGRSVEQDVNKNLEDVVEDAELQLLARSGAPVPLLSCRRVDFSYGRLQVLFDVSFTVDDGEMVALLGTNGAGKSTLLRVISGLGLPSRGSVRYQGVDITALDAERRVPLGIAQVPGGRAVFGHLTVYENLRLTGFTHGRNRRAIEAGIEESFDRFPRLAERRNQHASTLSGGEQQMLGLSKAFIVKPRLLLIDELSLGLAPQVVSELLVMVRRINDAGTAVVLVEQSVNIALSLVNHAYFMEKGEIKFDGRSEELIERGDLLRAVFLKGAGAGMRET